MASLESPNEQRWKNTDSYAVLDQLQQLPPPSSLDPSTTAYTFDTHTQPTYSSSSATSTNVNQSSSSEKPFSYGDLAYKNLMAFYPETNKNNNTNQTQPNPTVVAPPKTYSPMTTPPQISSPEPQIRQSNSTQSENSFVSGPSSSTENLSNSVGTSTPQYSYPSPQTMSHNNPNHQILQQQPYYQMTQQYEKQQPQPQLLGSSNATSASNNDKLMSEIQSLQNWNREQKILIEQQSQQQAALQKQVQVLQQSQTQSQQQTKDLLEKMQASFNKILSFVELVDQRLTNLERVSQTILSNQSQPSAAIIPHPAGVMPPVQEYPKIESQHVDLSASQPVSMPSYMVNNADTSYNNIAYPSVGSAVASIQRAEGMNVTRRFDQEEEDRRLAEKLQREFEDQAKKEEAKSGTAKKDDKKTPTPAPRKDSKTKPVQSSSGEIVPCPVCSMQVLKTEVDIHVNSHFEDDKKPEKSTATPTPQPPKTDDKPGFFTRMFGAKNEPAPSTEKPAESTKPAAPTPSTSASHPTYALPTATSSATTGTLPSAYQQAPPPNYQPNQIYQMPSIVYRTGPQPGYGYPAYQYPGSGVVMPGQAQPGAYMYYPAQSPNQNK